MRIRNTNEPWTVLLIGCGLRWPLTRRPRQVGRAFLPVVLRCALLLVLGAQVSTAIQISSSPTAPSDQARSDKYSFFGTVVDSVTGEPIRKALVQLHGAQQYTVFSDGDGRFQFGGLPAGVMSLSAQKPGYFGEQELRSRMPASFEVGPKSESAVIKLTPEGIIAGRVATTTGAPLEHVPLSLTYLNVRDGRRHSEVKGNTFTDEDGRFRFANLLPGSYYLSAGPITPMPETLFDAPPRPKTGYSEVYYPGVPDLASASAIALSAGQQIQADFALQAVPVFNVSGTISGYAANQGVGIQLCDQSGNPLPLSYQFSPENSRFDFHGVPAGLYILKANSQSAPNQPVRVDARLSVASDIYDLRLALAPAITIPISVQKESVSPPTRNDRNYARFSAQGFPLGARLMSNQAGIGDAYANLEGPPSQQTLIFRNVEPGRYSVEFMPQPPWYVLSAEYGQTNLLTDDLTVGAGAQSSTIQVVLRDDNATLSGTVTPSAGVKVPATIVAIPERFPKASAKMAYYSPPSDKPQGPIEGFSFSALAPGDYLVFAFDHLDGIEYSNPDVLQTYASQAAHVTLSPNQHAKVTLELIHTGDGSN